MPPSCLLPGATCLVISEKSEAAYIQEASAMVHRPLESDTPCWLVGSFLPSVTTKHVLYLSRLSYFPVQYNFVHPRIDVFDPLPQTLQDADKVYMVHALLDSCRCKSQLQSLLDLKGYRLEECLWVPVKDILDPNLVTTNHRDNLQRPGPGLRSRPLHLFRPLGNSHWGRGGVLSHPEGWGV